MLGIIFVMMKYPSALALARLVAYFAVACRAAAMSAARAVVPAGLSMLDICVLLSRVTWGSVATTPARPGLSVALPQADASHPVTASVATAVQAPSLAMRDVRMSVLLPQDPSWT